MASSSRRSASYYYNLVESDEMSTEGSKNYVLITNLNVMARQRIKVKKVFRCATSEGPIVDVLRNKYQTPRITPVEQRIKQLLYELNPYYWGKPEYAKDVVQEVISRLPHRIAA